MHRQHADLRRRAGRAPRAEACGQQLRAEADAPDRHSAGDGTCDQLFFWDEPGQPLILIRTHRAAHRDQPVEAVEPRNRLSLIDLDAHELTAPRQQLVLVGARRLTRDVLEHEQLQLALASSGTRLAGRRPLNTSMTAPIPRARSSASALSEYQAECGVTSTRGWWSSRFAGLGGSSVSTSSAAPASASESSASASASSSINAPRATLTRYAVG